MLFKKILSIVNYIGAFVLLALAFVGGMVLYPFVYPFRNINFVRNNTPFWWFFDDEDGFYGAEYWRTAKGITKNSFWVSYRWSALRNPMWNAHTKIRPNSGKEVIVRSWGKLTRGEETSLSNSATLNYEDYNGNYQGNTGDYLSLKFSYLGWAFIWFTKNDKLYWRFSLAMRLFGKRWIEIQLGAFYRYIFKVKSTVVKNNI